MARTTEDVGLLLVHGIGEQVRFEHLRKTGKQLASLVTEAPGLIRLEIRDETEGKDGKPPVGTITIDAVFARGGREEQVRLHLREVWWADLGIKGGLLPQLKFWLWGLGQWAAQVVLKGNPQRNTTQLMEMPRFPPWPGRVLDWIVGQVRGFLSRTKLFFAGLLAFLTFFTWSAAKRLLAFLTNSLPEPSLIFQFLGDVKTYEEPSGHGGGTLLDPDQPVRTTIRRRMAREMVAMATAPHDRWYIFAHSLGSVAAFNLVQETEWTLPNYLSKAEWTALPDGLKTQAPFTPPNAEARTDNMMPRRPPWLGATDGIDRKMLFAKFAGLLTYGCPLDKFATLWPRVVPLNLQTAIFPPGCEWVNLYDPTDPVSGALDAFAPPAAGQERGDKDPVALTPTNAASRAGLAFGLSHIDYFRPRKPGPRSMPNAIVDALVTPGRPSLAKAAANAAMGKPGAFLRRLLGLVQLAFVSILMLIAAGGLLVMIGKALPDALTDRMRDALAKVAPDLVAAIQQGGWEAVVAGAWVALGVGLVTVLGAGLLRILSDLFSPQRKVPKVKPAQP